MLSLRGVEKESCTRYIAHHIPTSTFTYSPITSSLSCTLRSCWSYCSYCFREKTKHVDWCRNLFEIERERENLNATLCAWIENLFWENYSKFFQLVHSMPLDAFCGWQCEQSLRVIVHLNLSHSWLRLHCFSGCRRVRASLPVEGVRSCPRTCNGPDLVRTLERGLENIRDLSWILSDSSSA